MSSILIKNPIIIGGNGGIDIYGNCYESGGSIYIKNDDNDYYYLYRLSDSNNISSNCYEILPYAGYKSSRSSVSIPSNVIKIGAGAFKESNLTSITIPSGVESIGAQAFTSCNSLTSADLSDATELKFRRDDYNIFEGCHELTTVNLPDELTSIPQAMFNGCYKLTTVNFPTNLSSIETSAFYDCSDLSDFTFPTELKHIGYSAFKGCESLTTIFIPENVTEIDARSFEDCKGLTSISVDANNSRYYNFNNSIIESRDGNNEDIVILAINSSSIPESIQRIQDGACTYGIFGSNGNSYTLPSSLKYIGSNAFEGSTCYLIIPTNVQNISNYAFSNVTGSISWSDPVNSHYREIYSYTFQGLDADLTLPSTIQNIHDYAFERAVVNSINYAGTMDQWNNISKDSDWNYQSAITAIYCSDGTLSTDGTVIYDDPDDPGDEPMEEEQEWYVSVNSIQGAIISGDGYYYDGDECTVSIEPDEYHGLADVSATINGDPLTLNIDGDRYYATFIVNEDIDIVFSASIK